MILAHTKQYIESGAYMHTHMQRADRGPYIYTHILHAYVQTAYRQTGGKRLSCTGTDAYTCTCPVGIARTLTEQVACNSPAA